MDLATALQTVTDGVKQYMSALSPSERDAFDVGARATHFEEAVAQRDFVRASAHAAALGVMMQKKSYVMHVSGGRVLATTLPATLSPQDKRDIAMATTPIPGLVVAKVMGATWPIAGVAGMLTAPVVMYVGAKLAAHVGALLAVREKARPPVHLMPVSMRAVQAKAHAPHVHLTPIRMAVPGAPQPVSPPVPGPAPAAAPGGNGGPPGGNGGAPGGDGGPAPGDGGDGGDGGGPPPGGNGGGNGGAPAPSNGNGGSYTAPSNGNGGGAPVPSNGNGGGPPPQPPAPTPPAPAPAPAADPTALAQQVVDDMALGADPTADVTAFQQAIGLPVTGVVDDATQAAIAQLGVTGPSPAAQAQLQAQQTQSGGWHNPLAIGAILAAGSMLGY